MNSLILRALLVFERKTLCVVDHLKWIKLSLNTVQCGTSAKLNVHNRRTNGHTRSQSRELNINAVDRNTQIHLIHNL